MVTIYLQHDSEISIGGLSAIAELFYRQSTLPFPHIIANGIVNILKQPQLNVSNELYQDKLTELMQLFIQKELPRWIDDDVVFPQILNQLYTFTFESEFNLENWYIWG